MTSQAPPASRHVRWWSWWLVAHAVVVVAVLVVYGISTSGAGGGDAARLPQVVLSLTGALSLLLSTPWWLVVGALWAIPLDDGDTTLLAVLGWVTQVLPLLVNLVLHAVVLGVVRRRRAVRSPAAVSSAPVAASGRGRALLLSAVAGAVTWLAWLGWDRTASYDIVTGTTQYPYVTLQVLGCAACVGLLVAGLAAARRPLEGAAGVTLGFWVVWTVDAVTQDDSGLAGVGAVMLLFGLALGTATAAAAGWGVRLLVDAARRRRAVVA